jgi:hypothetical protein
MTDFTPDLALTCLRNNLTAVQIADQAERDAYLVEIEKRLGRSADDKKGAAKLAIETAKMFLTIAIAVFVVTGTLLQFARTNGVPWSSWTIWAFCATVVLLLISMRAGFVATSKVFKRADGRTNAGDIAWTTEPIARDLDVQSWTGLLALFFLLGGLVHWAAFESDAPAAALSVSVPSISQAPLPKGPLTIEGVWTELRVKTAGNLEFKLPPTASPVLLTCK